MTLTMTVTAAVMKRCPYRYEADAGTVTLAFRVIRNEDGPELHELRDYLDTFTHQSLSHEAFIRRVQIETGAVEARATWNTAGMEVSVECSTSATPAAPPSETP